MHLRLAQLDKVLISGAGWKASNVQVGFTQLLSTAVVAAVVAAVCAGAGRSHGVGSWCIGLLETEQNKAAVTGKQKHGVDSCFTQVIPELRTEGMLVLIASGCPLTACAPTRTQERSSKYQTGLRFGVQP